VNSNQITFDGNSKIYQSHQSKGLESEVIGDAESEREGRGREPLDNYTSLLCLSPPINLSIAPPIQITSFSIICPGTY
jgi:hypothetical protein